MLWRKQNITASFKPVANALRKIHFEDAAAQLESQFIEPEGMLNGYLIINITLIRCNTCDFSY